MFANMTEAGYLAYCAAWCVDNMPTDEPGRLGCLVDSASRAVRAGIVFG